MGPDGYRMGPRLVTAGIMAKVSTTRSGEDCLRPGPTLSYLIVQFDPFRAVIDFLALNLEYRKADLWPKLVKLLSLR